MITAHEAYNFKNYTALQEIERKIIDKVRDPTNEGKYIELDADKRLEDNICIELAKNGYEIFTFAIADNKMRCRIDWSGKYSVVAPIKDGERWGRFNWHPIKDYQYIRNN